MNHATHKICSNKKCSHKGVAQPKENFYKQTHNHDNLSDWCGSCHRERSKRFTDKVKERKEFLKMFAV